ncbi:hypothetical protein RyT2_02900 [Pseudolactococcus yaeyamensis]
MKILNKKTLKKFFILYILFWIPAILFLILFAIFGKSNSIMVMSSEIDYSFWKIFTNNLVVAVLLYLLGYLHRYLVYLLYFINAMSFTFLFSLSIERYQLIDVLFRLASYGLTEIMAFTLVVVLALQKKNRLFTREYKVVFLSILLLVFSAWIESIVI